MLTDAGLSWVDQSGGARIALPGLYIRTDSGRGAPMSRAHLGCTAGALAVCEGLLVGAGGAVAQLVEATGLAPSTVANALKFLQGEHLLDAQAARGRNARRTVVDRDQLLDAYAAAAARLRSPGSIRVGVLWRDPARGAGELGARLASNGVAWSITCALAADALAPYLTEVDPLEIYLDAGPIAELRQVAREVGLNEASGGRLLLRPFPTPARDALSGTVGKQRLSPWPRVFADLRTIGVRGEEAAEHLRDEMGARVSGELERTGRARRAAELGLARVCSHYGERPNFVLLGGLVPAILCSDSDRLHAGTTDVDVQVDLEIAGGAEHARRLELTLKNADFRSSSLQP